MKTDLTNRARCELLHALHDLDEYEDHGNPWHAKDARRRVQIAEAALVEMESLDCKADKELRDYAQHLRGQQSQNEDRL